MTVKEKIDAEGEAYVDFRDGNGFACVMRKIEDCPSPTILLGGACLSQENVRELLPYLRTFAKTGKLRKKPATKAQLWRRVARLAGELAFSSQYAIPFTWHECLNAADSVRSLIKHVRGFDEMDSMDKRHHEKTIRKLETALAAWEAAE